MAPYLVVLPFGGTFFLLILRRRPVNLDKDERERERDRMMRETSSSPGAMWAFDPA